MQDKDPLKQRIRRGEIIIGVSAPLDSDRGQLEEILSKDTYDFITLASQHSPSMVGCHERGPRSRSCSPCV